MCQFIYEDMHRNHITSVVLDCYSNCQQLVMLDTSSYCTCTAVVILILPTQVYSGNSGRAMVFTSTKIEANELALNAVLKQVIDITSLYSCDDGMCVQDCQVLHGDIPQKQREITLKVNFVLCYSMGL